MACDFLLRLSSLTAIVPGVSDSNEKNRLEFSLLHRVMVFFQQTAGWPGWLLPLLAILLAGVVIIAWLLVNAGWLWAAAAGLLHFLFLSADMLFLWSLPRRRLSFGPWQAQSAVLAIPRTVAALVLALLLPWLGSSWTLFLLAAVEVVGSGLLYWGAAVEPFRLSLTRLELALPGLPAGSTPLRLLHISDLHLERMTRREEQVLALAKQAEPDLILITGDYVNLSYNEDEVTHYEVRELLRRLEAPFGVYATLGSPPVDLPHVIPALFSDLPVRLLRDEWECLDLPGGRQLVLLGLDCSHDLDVDGARLRGVLQQAPNGVPRVLLYHSPELMPEAARHGLDLYLCGHTHGGQVRLPGYGAILTSSQLGRAYVMGHYREGKTNLYVSRGVGLEGLSAPRVRFLSPPEITLVTLRPVS